LSKWWLVAGSRPSVLFRRLEEHISHLGTLPGRVFYLSFHKEPLSFTGSEGLPPRVGPYRHHSYGHVRPPPLYGSSIGCWTPWICPVRPSWSQGPPSPYPAPPCLGLFSGGTRAVHSASDDGRPSTGAARTPTPFVLYKRSPRGRGL